MSAVIVVDTYMMRSAIDKRASSTQVIPRVEATLFVLGLELPLGPRDDLPLCHSGAESGHEDLSHFGLNHQSAVPLRTARATTASGGGCRFSSQAIVIGRNAADGLCS